jgi:hypothetical protein
MPGSLGAYGLRDRLWGDDVGLLIGLLRLAAKMLLAGMLAWVFQWGLVYFIFHLSAADIDSMNRDIQQALDKKEIPVIVVLANQSRSGDPGLSYTLSKKNAAADGTANDLYDLEPLGWGISITRPKIEDSLDVMLRKIERVWLADNRELKLCAETRKVLDKIYCDDTEYVRETLADEAYASAATTWKNPWNFLKDLFSKKSDASKPSLRFMSHLQSIRTGAMLLGLIQWLTLTLFVFAVLECVGLDLRWIRPKTFLSKDYSTSPSTLSELMADVQNTANERVRNTFDRFIVRGTDVAMRAGRSEVRDTLRNFRDHLLEDSTAKQDLLEVLGDTILKVAFLGTVFGIGTALYYARDLDAADPLMRLSAKAQMYAGIGTGFGATMVGIGLSVFAAKFRMWLAQRWAREIESAWLKATNFFDRFSDYPATAAPVGSVGGGQPASLADHNLSRPPLHESGQIPLVDWVLLVIGSLLLLGVFGWLITLLIQMIPKY